jgi:ribosomal protein S18 acetylase RimI-like enzyme
MQNDRGLFSLKEVTKIIIQPITSNFQKWVIEKLIESWGSTRLVSRGKVHPGERLAGFIAIINLEPVGLCTYHIAKSNCEIVSLNSYRENVGIGSALIDAVIDHAGKTGCHRLWLITTNDNLHALKFYQKFGFHLVKIYRDAIQESRKLKPQIPETGMHGIPIRDEIELEITL